MNNKIGIYIRVSSEEQARIQEGSLVSQRQRLEEFVKQQNQNKRGWGSVIDIYCDEAKSAKNMDRPEFQRLLRDVKSGKVNLMLATELSRLSRSIKDFCHVWDFLKENKAKFITLRDQFDTTTASGELMLFNLMNYAQFERKQTGERITANFTARAYRGLWNGGTIPMGYKRCPEQKSTLLVDKTEAEKLKKIFAIFLKTGNLHQTCRTLNDLGIKTKAYTNRNGESRGGNLFSVQSLHHILTNASVIGMREINKRRGSTERVKASWPAILDKKSFDAVQTKLEANRRKFKPNEWKTYAYPLTGLVKCGECGLPLNGKSAHGKTKKHHYYDHPRTLRSFENGHIHKCEVQRLRAEPTEDKMLQSLKRVLLEPGQLEKGIAAFKKSQNKETPRLEKEIKLATTEVKQIHQKIKNLVDRVAELPSDISAEPMYDRIKEMQKQIEDKENGILRLEKDRGSFNGGDVTNKALKTVLQKAIARIEEAPKEKQREIFENVIQFAEFYPQGRIRLGVYTESDLKEQKRQKKSIGAAKGSSGAGVYSIFGNQESGVEGCSRTIKIGGEGGIRTPGTGISQSTV
jgi:site-specific DNA recombinase